MRDITLGKTFTFRFSTRAFATGIPTALAGSPVLSYMEDGTDTPITTGMTFAASSVAGFNKGTVVATGANGFEIGKVYDVYLSAGTVDSVSVVGEKVYEFTVGVDKAKLYAGYMGSKGYGICVNDAAANTDTDLGTDGTFDNPVSTLAAARTLADALGVKRYYLTTSDFTLAATHEDWDFVGEGEFLTNIINLGTQDVDRSHFHNLSIEGTQGGTERIYTTHCALQDPGAGDTTLHVFAQHCGIVDRIQLDTSADNVLDLCYSLVAGSSAPVIEASGVGGTIALRHYSGGIEFESLSATHNVSVEGDGQVIFAASCNIAASVSLRGLMTITDNTAGMSSLTQDAVVNMLKINTEADTAISDAALATAAAVSTIDGKVDTIAGYLDTEIAAILAAVASTGVVLSAAQMNKIADHTIRRHAANARASSDGDTVDKRSLLGAISKLVNKVAVVATNLVAYEEDDSTPFLTQAISTDATADPIDGLDTA